jgi:hypothetical protein
MALSTEEIIEKTFLEVCPPAEAVEWLKRTRESATGKPRLLRNDNKHQEETLYLRSDAFIEFGLAKYGFNDEVAQRIYQSAGPGIRCTLLASFPGGGFDPIFSDRFLLHSSVPNEIQELCALFSNPTLSDDTLQKLLERSTPFDSLTDEQFEAIIIALAKNPRMSTPYDETYLDGYRDYSYNKVFSSAWQLAEIVPATPRWANVLYYLLENCVLPRGVNSIPMIGRWHFPTDSADKIDAGYFLRSRLADLLAADNALLGARDPALRSSFYRRFKPPEFPSWFKFAESDSEHFLDSALHNPNLWRAVNDRETLSQLSWNHPDPRSDLMMVNQFRAVEGRMQQQHPEWFND